MAFARSPISRPPGHAASTAARIVAGSSLRGLSSVTIATSAKPRGRGAHQRALAAVAIAAGAEHHVQPARGVWTQRGQQPFQRVRRMGVVDVHGSAVWQTRRQFQPPAHAVQERKPIQHVGLTECGGQGGGHQRVVGLEAARQQQP